MTLLRKLFFVSCSVSFLASAAQSQSSPKICAEAVVVIGKVTEEPSGKMVRVGEKLAEGVKLKTNSDAFVKLLLKDNSVIDISPQTQFFLKQCAAPELIGIDLELELGRVRANVNSEPARPRKKFQMKTPTSVLAVRGTEFFVSWGKDGTGFVNERVSVSEGQVEIRSLFQQNAPPTLLQTGTEFKAEGRLQNENKQLPRIDQFNAPEQRQLEQEQKIEAERPEQRSQFNSRRGPVEGNAPQVNVVSFQRNAPDTAGFPVAIPVKIFEQIILGADSNSRNGNEQAIKKVGDVIQTVLEKVADVYQRGSKRGLASSSDSGSGAAGQSTGQATDQTTGQTSGQTAGQGNSSVSNGSSTSTGGQTGTVINSQNVFVSKSVFMKVKQ